MSERKPRRFFWFEGVTRSEVERSLNDTRPSALRRQRNRRILVGASALMIAALALVIFIAQAKIKSYAEIVCMAGTLIAYVQLRKAVRHVSDAPDELLDERQIAIRDAGHTVAYRALCFVSVPYMVVVWLIQPDGAWAGWVASPSWWNILMSYAMCAGSLPAMVLAWRMPDEPQPQAD
jgi:hypothetical protein